MQIMHCGTSQPDMFRHAPLTFRFPVSDSSLSVHKLYGPRVLAGQRFTVDKQLEA